MGRVPGPSVKAIRRPKPAVSPLNQYVRLEIYSFMESMHTHTNTHTYTHLRTDMLVDISNEGNLQNYYYTCSLTGIYIHTSRHISKAQTHEWG